MTGSSCGRQTSDVLKSEKKNNRLRDASSSLVVFILWDAENIRDVLKNALVRGYIGAQDDDDCHVHKQQQQQQQQQQ